MTGKRAPQRPQLIRRLIVHVLKVTRLHAVLHDALDWLPPSLQRVAVWVGGKKELVPRESLKASFRIALRWLLQSEPDSIGDYVEFGVYQGTSLACFHQVSAELGLSHIRLFGFDSFEGLPPTAAREDLAAWQPGEYKSSLSYTTAYLNHRRIDWRRITLIKGWFSDTATPDMAARYGLHNVSVAMIDCDLYSSTKDALRFLAPLLHKEAVIIFDDWASHDLEEADLGEKLAFEEFLAENPQWQVHEQRGYHALSRIFYLVEKNLDESDEPA